MKYSPTQSKAILVNELHRYAKRKFKRRRIIIKGLDETWQADLIDLSAHYRKNKGFKYILIVIDNFSKYTWGESLKKKSAEEVSDKFEKILKSSKRKPKNLQTDDGKEFFNKKFQNIMTMYKINHYKTYSSIKAAIAERVIRTIKEKIYKSFSLYGNYNWIDKLQDIIKNYNDTKHRTIKMKPKDVKKDSEQHLLDTVYSNMNMMGEHKYNIGDIVRISKYKHVFEKGYLPNWTTELFEIVKVCVTNPVVYLLKDMQGQPIQGCFYEDELQKTSQPNVYI